MKPDRHLIQSLIILLLLCQSACNTIEPTSFVTSTAVPTDIPEQTPTPAPTKTPSPTAAPSPTPLPAHLQVDLTTLRGRKIRFWYPWTGELDVQAVKLTQEFNQNNEWGIKVEAWPMGGSSALFDALQSNLATNDLPHVVAATNDQLLALQSKTNIVMDLNDYIRLEKLGLTSVEIADFLPVFWQQDDTGGYRLGIPAQRTLEVLFYNRTWAEQLGFKNPPATPQEFLEQACAAAAANLKDATRGNDGTGGWIIDTRPLTIIAWLGAFENQPAAAISGNLYQFNQPASLEAFTFLRKLYDQNCAWNSRNPTPYEYFVQRQALFYSGSLQDIPAQARIQLKANGTDRWTVLAYPSQNKQGSAVVSGTSLALLNSQPTEQLAAWLFIRWMSHPENQARLALAGGSVPVSRSALQNAGAGPAAFPQIGQAYPLAEKAVPAPGLASWRTARKVLEDAAIQILQPVQAGTKVDIPGILLQLDFTIKDLTP